jgi:flagellar L-ring protein precursor FlgH
MTVKAMEDGKLGRVIRVQNTGPRKLLKPRRGRRRRSRAVAGPENEGIEERFMKRTFLAVLAVLTLMGGSLWAGFPLPVEGTNSLYTENRARRVGDVITIIILETTNARSPPDRRTRKNSNLAVGAGLGSWGTSGTNPMQQYGLGGQSFQQGQGTSSRSPKVVGQMTAKSRGSCRAGTTWWKAPVTSEVNEDKQRDRGVGEHSPGRHLSDNTVSSSRVANARIKVTGPDRRPNPPDPGLLTPFIQLLMVF